MPLYREHRGSDLTDSLVSTGDVVNGSLYLYIFPAILSVTLTSNPAVIIQLSDKVITSSQVVELLGVLIEIPGNSQY